jgi:hypothetical protein
MDDRSLLEHLRESGCIAATWVEVWRECAELLAALDAIGRQGGNALVKVDGARPDGAFYTVVISGGRLGEAFFRKDGADLPALLREAVSFYVAHVGGKPPRSS